VKKLNTYFRMHAQNCIGALGAMTRQPLASSLTIAVIGIALAMPSALNVIVQNGRAVAGGWDNIRDFSVYLKPNTPVERARELRDQLDASPVVESARMITADDALLEFQDDPEFGELLTTLESNPLPHTIVVRPTEDVRPPDLQELASALARRSDVDLVKLDTDWVRRLNAMLDLVRRGVWIAGSMLLVAVIVIIGNTIRLDIQNRREEIEVTKLIGASNAFVRRPFLYSGLWYGLGGGLLALALVGYGLYALEPPVKRLAGLYDSAFTVLDLDISESLVIIGIGVLLGLAGSWLAAARHMRRIEPR